jgi:hypothetical protein
MHAAVVVRDNIALPVFQTQLRVLPVRRHIIDIIFHDQFGRCDMKSNLRYTVVLEAKLKSPQLALRAHDHDYRCTDVRSFCYQLKR